jgi:hypothetical protein
MKNMIRILSAAWLVMMTGCGSDEENFSRYPSVVIPGFHHGDYIRDLSDPRPERVYNAVCNLGNSASGFARTLCAKDADPASDKYKQADEAYRAVSMQLDSEEPHTAAAGLRFLALFSGPYKQKEELAELAIRVESDHPLVQFEQASLLNRVVDEDSQLPEPLLRRLLNSPSWIVSRTTYGLIGKLEDDPLRRELVKRYGKADEERERLLLIEALGQRLEPEEARMLEAEVLATESRKLRHAVLGTLMENLHVSGIRQWFQDHYVQLEDEEKTALFEASLFQDSGELSDADIDFACDILSQGYKPDDDLLEAFTEPPSDDTDEFERTAWLRLEKEILSNPELSARLDILKKEARQEQLRKEALREEIKPFREEFVEEIKAVLAKHDIPDKKQEETLKKISSALTSLTN